MQKKEKHWALLYSNDEENFAKANILLNSAFKISNLAPTERQIYRQTTHK